MYNAIHYVDHFAFLSDKTPGVHGIFSTYIPLNSGQFWQLNFVIAWEGELKDNGDGIMIGASLETPSPQDI